MRAGVGFRPARPESMTLARRQRVVAHRDEHRCPPFRLHLIGGTKCGPSMGNRPEIVIDMMMPALAGWAPRGVRSRA